MSIYWIVLLFFFISVTDDHHFKNDYCLLYQFAFDFEQSFNFQNVFTYSMRTHSRNMSDSSLHIPDFLRKMSSHNEKSHSSSSESHDDQLDPRRRQSDPFTCKYWNITWMHSFPLIFLWFVYQNVSNSYKK